LSLPGRWQGNEHTAAKTARTVVWAYLLFAFAAGVVLPLQAGINAELADWLHSPIRAAFVSWWVWLGGALGAFYVVGSIVSAPKLGAATLIGLIVAGQAIASLIVDHFGWVGFEPKPISAGRLVGMGLVGAGVVLARIF
jgi:bacterial/archaeal transporter family-2 protein